MDLASLDVRFSNGRTDLLSALSHFSPEPGLNQKVKLGQQFPDSTTDGSTICSASDFGLDSFYHWAHVLFA